MFEFLKKKPFSRWKFVQRMLDRTGDSRRRRLSADTDDGSEDGGSVDGSRGDRRPRDADSSSLDCSERVVVSGGEAGDRERGKGEPQPRPSAAAEATAGIDEAEKEAMRTVIQQSSATLNKARVTAQVDIPYHARGHYSIGCDVKTGSAVSPAADVASTAADGAANAATASAASAPPRRGSSWHSSLRETKSKGMLQMSKLRISFRKKPSTSQADYDVLSDDHGHLDSAAVDDAEGRPARERTNDLGRPETAAPIAEATLTESGDGRPRTQQQAVADAVRRSFRKTTKYLRYGTQSVTITKPATSLNWATSSTTRQTLI